MNTLNKLSLKLFSFNVRPMLVTSDVNEINFYPLMGFKKCIHWNELEEVLIETTDQRPFKEDLFIIMKASNTECK